MWAFLSILGFRALLASPAILNSMISSGWFHATEANMVFFCSFETLIDTECSELTALIRPVG